MDASMLQIGLAHAKFRVHQRHLTYVDLRRYLADAVVASPPRQARELPCYLNPITH